MPTHCQALSGISFPLVWQMLVFPRVYLQFWLVDGSKASMLCMGLTMCTYKIQGYLFSMLCSFVFASLCFVHTWCEWRCLSERRPPGTPSPPRARPRPGNCCTCPPRSHGDNPSWSQPAEAQRDELPMLQALSDTGFDLLFFTADEERFCDESHPP